MRVITVNVNGIRAACRKGLFDWLRAQNADVVCVQETKAQLHQLRDDDSYFPLAHNYYHDAEKKGYSGVALYSAHQPDQVITGLGKQYFDREGRWLQADFGNLSIVSLYLPSGSSSEARQAIKFRVMKWLMPHLRKLARDGRQYLVCGDWNIAHREIDLKNWRGNRKNSGFLPEERAWMDKLFGAAGWVDTFRRLEAGPDHYTWWSNRGQAWAKNVGWRIDYQVATPALAASARHWQIHTADRFSDHAPLVIDYDWDLGESST